MGLSGEIKFVDDILAPREDVVVEYSGKNPILIATIALRLLRDVMKIPSSSLREDEIRWDVTGKMKMFYGVWRGYRGEDRFTKTQIKIIAEGAIDAERNGWVRIVMRGFLSTKFEFSNPLEKLFLYMFNYTFYWKQRRNYIDFSKDNIMQIREEILSAYRILREEAA